ncbi:MAG TPA: ATP-binding protein [Anaerolineae bacterium]
MLSHPVSTLRLSAELRSLAAIRTFIEDTAAALRIDHDTTLDLLQAVDECATNIIVHGYRGRPGPIEIEMGRNGNVLIVRLRDRAPLFDPTQLPLPDISLPLEQRPVGGMGVFLARRLTDGMTYRVTPQGGNELTLIKKTHPLHPAEEV